MVLSDGMVHFLKIKIFFLKQIYQNYHVALILFIFIIYHEKPYFGFVHCTCMQLCMHVNVVVCRNRAECSGDVLFSHCIY